MYGSSMPSEPSPIGTSNASGAICPISAAFCIRTVEKSVLTKYPPSLGTVELTPEAAKFVSNKRLSICPP